MEVLNVRERLIQEQVFSNPARLASIAEAVETRLQDAQLQLIKEVLQEQLPGFTTSFRADVARRLMPLLFPVVST